MKVSNQLVSLASREALDCLGGIDITVQVVSNQLVSLASRESSPIFLNQNLKRDVSNQLVSLASREC